MITEIEGIAKICKRDFKLTLSPTDFDILVREVQERAVNTEIKSIDPSRQINVTITQVNKSSSLTMTFEKE